jgi:hypothetical protein
MSAQHTPGPWKVVGVAREGVRHSRVAAKTLIARVYSEAFGDVAQEEANARLIAAAPDLLAVARMAAEQFELYAEQHRKKQTQDGDAKEAVNRAKAAQCRAAIAKAEGR